MTFKKAVQQTPAITEAYKPGLGALRNADRARVSARNSRLLTGSIDLDAALRVLYPNAPRWDYGVGHKKERQPERVCWIEIHPAASSSNINEVTSKLNWLKRWLATEGARLVNFEKEFIWVSSGRTEFGPTSPDRRRLAAQGLIIRGRQFKIG